MNKKTEGKILDIAADIIVSPLAAYAKLCEIKAALENSETCEKTREAAKSAGNDIKKAAKKAYESEPVQKGVETVKDTAKKISGSDAYAKVKDGARKAKEGIDSARTKLGFKPGEAEGESCCCSDENKEAEDSACCCEENKEAEDTACCCADKPAKAEDETLKDVIEEVDLSDIITEDDENEDIPEI